MPRSPLPFVFRLTPAVLRLLKLDAARGKDLVRRCGLPEQAVHGSCTAPLSAVMAFMEEATLLSGDTAFALAVADAIPEGTYDAAELLVRTAPTLKLGLVDLARFAALINPVARFEVREQKDRVELHYDVPGEPHCLGPTMNEVTIAYLVRGLRLVAQRDLPLAGAWFVHDRPATAAAAIVRHLRCNVAWQATTCGVAFDASVADQPLGSSDPVTHEFLSKHATEHLRALGKGSMAAMVATVIEKQVGLADVNLAFVAKRLGMTERTAQRRLEGEGTSFRAVLDQVRERVAERLLTAGVEKARVADMLGFADSRSFHRATERWKTRT